MGNAVENGSVIDLAQLTEQAEQLKPISSDLAGLLALLEQDTGELSDLARLLVQDPVLVMWVLRLANSPFYGRAGKVSDLTAACGLLGRNTLRNLVQAVIARSMMTKLQPASFDSCLFWRHCLYAASVGSHCATSCGFPSGSVFTVGLFHDFGLLVLDCLYPEAIQQALASVATGHGGRLSTVIKQQSGIDHRTLMVQLFNHWGFPACVCDALAMQGEHGERVATLMHFACDTACSLGHGITQDNQLLDYELLGDGGVQLPVEQIPAILRNADRLFHELIAQSPSSGNA